MLGIAWILEGLRAGCGLEVFLVKLLCGCVLALFLLSFVHGMQLFD